jgi:TRAP-type C4-dicarboxylate transport system permease small subunit
MSSLKLTAKIARLVQSTTSVIDRISIYLARIVVTTFIAMMLLTCADVFLRYIFRRSIMGTTEVVGHYFMVTVVFLPLAYGMITRGGHIKVDFVVLRLPRRLQVVLETVGLFLSLCAYLLITWYGAVGGLHAWRTGETMVNVALPMWPGRVLVFVGGSLLCAQILVAICRNLERFSKNQVRQINANRIDLDEK